jgi:GT2 family glycosyltransferase
VHLAIIVIGRNEGERLRACLASLGRHLPATIYVDSGSTDGSVAHARSLGVEVVQLDPQTPFTAARARNAGLERAAKLWGDPEAVLFVDGDCTLAEGWLETALAELEAHADAAVVCGRRRERFPEASIFNRLCDMEWDTPLGEAEACGGDALYRGRALIDVGGFDPNMIAGEEPDLCYRLREAGWKVRRIEAEMTLHDAAIAHISQWWRRTKRSGHAVAELAHRHPRLGLTDRRRTRSSLMWSAVPFGGLVSALAGAFFAPELWRWWSVLPAGAGVLLAVQFARIGSLRRRRGDTPADARSFAFWCLAAKTPEALGWWTFTRNRRRGARSVLIEYKGGAQGAPPEGSGETRGDSAP